MDLSEKKQWAFENVQGLQHDTWKQFEMTDQYWIEENLTDIPHLDIKNQKFNLYSSEKKDIPL